MPFLACPISKCCSNMTFPCSCTAHYEQISTFAHKTKVSQSLYQVAIQLSVYIVIYMLQEASYLKPAALTSLSIVRLHLSSHSLVISHEVNSSLVIFLLCNSKGTVGKGFSCDCSISSNCSPSGVGSSCKNHVVMLL